MDLLYFQLGGAPYAIALTSIADVSPAGPIHPVPLSPPTVLGLAERRGRAIAVIDLPQLLDTPPVECRGAGIDGRVLVAHHSEKFPLDASLTAGFGGLFASGTSHFYIPLGASLGRQVLLENSNISFTPFVAPVIAPNFGDGPDDTLFGLGLGVDIALSKTFDARVSGALGDYDGVGVGLAWHR